MNLSSLVMIEGDFDPQRKPEVHKILAEHGTHWHGALWEGPKHEPGQCFRNAGRLAMASRRWRYVEGLAALRRDTDLVVTHAWLVDADTGECYDPTWGASEEVAYCGLMFSRAGHSFMLCAVKFWDLLWSNQFVSAEKIVKQLERKHDFTSKREVASSPTRRQA